MGLADITFDAIDGEAYDDEEGHHYNILVASCFDTGWKMVWNSNQAGKKQLPSEVCLHAITKLGHSPGRRHVAFSMGYDVTKWLEDLPEDLREQIFHGEVVIWKGYQIKYIPRKLFSITFIEKETGKHRSVEIYDVFGYFQTSFIKALKAWGLTREIEFIEEMKAKRGTFKTSEQNRVEKYSLMETDLLCQLMNRVRDALVAEEIEMGKFFGAGSIAEALLHKYNCQPHIRIDDWDSHIMFQEACLGAYFGGRFEIFKQGIFNSSHQYDINSAYPSAMAGLPSFRDSTIRAVRGYIPSSPYSIWFVTYKIPDKEFPIGPFPYRTSKGSILFPHENSYGIWVHQVELHMALQLYGDKYFQIHNGYVIRTRETSAPFNFIYKVARHRLALKRKGDQRNIVLKLGLNSLYGKTAQSVASTGKKPPFQNFYIAGYITAATRARLLEFAFTCGKNGKGVIQFATDGVFTNIESSSQGTVSSERLGEWEYKLLDRPTIYLKPGIYFVERKEGEDAKDTTRKTRGFRKNRLSVDDVFTEWRRRGPFGKLDATDKRFIGIGTCIVRKNWSEYGRWEPAPNEIKFNPGPSKLYKYGGQLAVGRGENGSTSNDAPDYYLLVPFNKYVDGESRPYVLHHVDKIQTLDEYDDYTQAAIRTELLYSEQPDYEQYIGFGDAGPQD